MKTSKFLIKNLIIILAIALPLFSMAANKNSNSSFWSRFNIFGNRAQAEINTRPNISGITAPTMLETGQMGTWKVLASDRNNGTLSYAVNWGDEGATPMRISAEEAFVQEATFTHAYNNPGKYTVTFTVKNEGGMEATSKVTVRVVGEPVENGPEISDVSASKIKHHQATISWKTDVRADSHLWLSTESPVDTSGEADVVRSAKVKNHKIKLTDLEDGTKYYVIVGSSNEGGATLSSEISFTTPEEVDEEAPVIEVLEGPTTVEAGAEIEIMVKAHDPENGDLSYSVDWGDEMSVMAMNAEEPFTQEASFSHVYEEEGNYTATFTVKNNLGKEDKASIEITVTEADGEEDDEE